MSEEDLDRSDARRADEERLQDAEDKRHPDLAIASEGLDGPAIAADVPKLAVVVGHTARAPGATGGPPINQSEYPWNTDLARTVKQRCGQQGFDCRIFFRDGVGISGAYAAVEQWQATAVVELHFNAADGHASGTETLYGDVAGSKGYARATQGALVAALGLTDRGIKHRAPPERGGESVNSASMPSILVEPFFGDHPGDAARASQRKADIARAVVDGFAAVAAGGGA